MPESTTVDTNRVISEQNWTVREYQLFHDAIVMCLQHVRPMDDGVVEVLQEWAELHDRLETILVAAGLPATPNPQQDPFEYLRDILGDLDA